jgi:hypothetical protein
MENGGKMEKIKRKKEKMKKKLMMNKLALVQLFILSIKHLDLCTQFTHLLKK